MIYTDGVHLVTDSLPDELHGFAESLGLKREWYQGESRYPHYDLTTPRMVKKALFYGAKKVTSKELVKILKGELDGRQIKSVCISEDLER